MAEALRFGDVLEAADRLSREEQQALLEQLQKRLAERRRADIAEEVREARREHRRGEARPVTADELMAEILEGDLAG